MQAALLDDVGLGNPSSVHSAGRKARALLERGREQVASAIQANANDIVLTSGGTESCNLGLHGLLHRERAGATPHLITSSIEHPAIAAPIAALEQSGKLRVTRLCIAHGIAPDASALRDAITSDTLGCAIQWVNHETGVRLPIASYAEVCRERGVPLLVDATQAAGKLAIDVASLGADLIALASHKLGGPAGAGALWIRRGVALEPQLRGGAQERGRRAGSPDVLAVIGFGAASAVIAERLAAQPHCLALRSRAELGLAALGFSANGARGERVSTAISASLQGARGEELVAALDLEGVCVSSGAACSSGLSAPSPVLLAMHPDQTWRASSALRFSFGPEARESDVDFALDALRRVLARGAG